MSKMTFLHIYMFLKITKYTQGRKNGVKFHRKKTKMKFLEFYAFFVAFVPSQSRDNNFAPKRSYKIT